MLRVYDDLQKLILAKAKKCSLHKSLEVELTSDLTFHKDLDGMLGSYSWENSDLKKHELKLSISDGSSVQGIIFSLSLPGDEGLILNVPGLLFETDQFELDGTDTFGPHYPLFCSKSGKFTNKNWGGELMEPIAIVDKSWRFGNCKTIKARWI